MDKEYILGADNGKTGFLVFLEADTGKVAHMTWYPNGDAKELYRLIETYKPVYAVIEQVFMAPGFKGVASSNFEIMGRYMQCFEMLDIPYDCVRAMTWRSRLGIKAKGRPAQKAASIAKATELYPEEEHKLFYSEIKKIENHKKVTYNVPDDNKAESMLIAYYARKTYNEQKAK